MRIAIAVVSVSISIGMAQNLRRPVEKVPPRVANAWMQVPTDLSGGDDVLPSLRSARDEFFDGLASSLGITSPLTPDSASRYNITEGSRIAGTPEIPAVPNRAIAIGKFLRSKSVLSASGRSVYTEITCELSDVFDDTTGHASPGRVVTLAFLGGSIKTNDGRVISLLTTPRRYFLEPGKTYLLVLRHYVAQEIYTVANDWDVSDGVVKANSPYDLNLEKSHGSVLMGVGRDQLSGVIKEILKNGR